MPNLWEMVKNWLGLGEPDRQAMKPPVEAEQQSPLQRVRDELKRWHGRRITPESRPGPWWEHKGWIEPGVADEMASENPERALLRDAIDWKGVSEETKSRILDEYWEPFPRAATQRHELNRLVESVGGWDNKEAVAELNRKLLDQLGDIHYEMAQITGGAVHVEYVKDGDGMHRSEKCLTREGIREDWHSRYGTWGIHWAFDAVQGSAKTLAMLHERKSAVANAGKENVWRTSAVQNCQVSRCHRRRPRWRSSWKRPHKCVSGSSRRRARCAVTTAWNGEREVV